jgi:hypothetical protein
MSDTPEKIIPANEMLVMLCADLEADGMLSPDQRAALKVALARNPELQEHYESFRFTRTPLASTFDALHSGTSPRAAAADRSRKPLAWGPALGRTVDPEPGQEPGEPRLAWRRAARACILARRWDRRARRERRRRLVAPHCHRRWRVAAGDRDELDRSAPTSFQKYASCG